MEKDDIFIALSFQLDASGKDAPVLFVWGERTVLKQRYLRVWGLVRTQHHELNRDKGGGPDTPALLLGSLFTGEEGTKHAPCPLSSESLCPGERTLIKCMTRQAFYQLSCLLSLEITKNVFSQDRFFSV